MDAQSTFASRDDIWRIFDELKELHGEQLEQAVRIARLERRREDDAKLKNVWSGPLSPYPIPIGEPAFHSPPEQFKGFDQGPPHAMSSSAMGGLDGDYEPRRGASRANSVRFDESAISGYLGQTNRSSTELPLRTGSGMGSHPLTERSLSHRSDRLSSSAVSLHSTRTNSLRLDTSCRAISSSFSASPLTPPPGLYLLGPVPSIIRCWLTTDYSNDSLLYAALCSGSFVSYLGSAMIHKLDLEDQVVHDADGRSSIKLILYLPEASIHQASSRSASPTPQLPSLTIRFLVRETAPDDETIQIVLGSDVMRSHNADILFSQDKVIMSDDDRNRVSVPLVRPEKDSVFKSLHTVPNIADTQFPQSYLVADTIGVIGEPARNQQQPPSAHASARAPVEEADAVKKPHLQEMDKGIAAEGAAMSGTAVHESPAKPEGAAVWKSWRREPKPEPSENNAKPRSMTVFKPSKMATRSSSQATSSTVVPDQAPVRSSSRGSGKSSGANPIGGGLAFPWLKVDTEAKGNKK
ncbi:hypothetical protein F1880_008714 [Penicillium rolfsii]|nr:hypothetical protein F1880_008714 [Penicillium rolfsii]